MSNREGRGRPRRDYTSRSDEKSHHGTGANRPSRHLWVGNLPDNLTERDLAHYFLRFGDIETVAFQPGRTYAFINYRNDEDAFAAIDELQGIVIGGNALRIEFTKAEKSMSDEHYLERKKEAYPRESYSFNDVNSRSRHSSPESPYLNKSKKVSNKDSEPNEVLWVGFPAQLKIDEFILRKAFSPFGEIEKIIAFPGRTFAFVHYRTVMAAYKAKEALHGKLFGNPRVHICFATNNESATSERGRSSTNAPASHYIESYRHSGSTERLRPDRNFRGTSREPSTRSPLYLEHGGNDYHEQRFDSDIRSYEHRNSPQRGIYREFPSKQRPISDNKWDNLPEDVLPFHNTKRLKSSHSFYQENELPDYPLSDLEKIKHVPPPSISQSRSFEDRLISSNFMNTGRRNGTTDSSQVAARPVLQPPPPISRSESAPKVVWKWEGMFAKGGTPVCRAKGFPVGKPMDMDLPEYIDCTARTSLEMLQEHYYNEAASAWVVFFSPADDADIVYYNEFMKYLSEKNRVAVAKLDEQTTLFLVPPSQFSEKVLKVAGQLSLSGVILRLRPPQNSSQYNGTDYEEKKQIAFSQTYVPNFPNYENNSVISGNLPSASSIPPPVESQGGHNSNSYLPKSPPGWDIQNFNPSTGNIGHLQTHNSFYTPDKQVSYPGGNIASEHAGQLTSSYPRGSIASEKAGQMTSSFPQSVGEYIPMNHSSGYPSSSSTAIIGSQNYYGIPNNQYQSAVPTQHQQFGQMQSVVPAQQQQFGQMQSVVPAQHQREVQVVAAQVSQQLQNGENSGEATPQVRLQATLQLAATLLQQIQQQKELGN